MKEQDSGSSPGWLPKQQTWNLSKKFLSTVSAIFTWEEALCKITSEDDLYCFMLNLKNKSIVTPVILVTPKQQKNGKN